MGGTHQTTLDGVVVHVITLLQALLFAVNVQGIESALPDAVVGLIPLCGTLGGRPNRASIFRQQLFSGCLPRALTVHSRKLKKLVLSTFDLRLLTP